MASDPAGEWVTPQEVQLHWIDPDTGQSLGASIEGHIKARAAWVGRYGNKWVEIFPGGDAYAKPN